MRRSTCFVSLVLSLTLGASAVGAEPPQRTCDALLSSADELLKTGLPAEAEESYKVAFGVCEKSEQSFEVRARLLERQGRALLLFESQPREGLAKLEDALTWVTLEGGEDDPARIELLDALVTYLPSYGGAAGRDLQRAMDLARESLRVRIQSYGARSQQAAAGWLELGSQYFLERPDLTEAHARRALGILAESQEPSPEREEALWVLALALEAQGRLQEADGIRAEAQRLGEVLRGSRAN